MSGIEDLVRARGAALRDDVAHSLNLEAALRDLHRRHGRRRRVQTVAAVAAAAAAIALILGIATWRHDHTDTQPAPSPDRDQPCQEQTTVHCLDGGRVEVDASTSFTVRLPDTFAPQLSPNKGTATVDAFRDNASDVAGVTFLDSVGPGRRQTVMSAAELARWVAARPYLDADAPVRTSVDGRAAWQVTVRVARAPARLVGACDGSPELCWPLLGAHHRPGEPWVTGPRPDMVSRYTFVSLPAGRPLGIWSWAYADSLASLDDNDELIASIRLGPS